MNCRVPVIRIWIARVNGSSVHGKGCDLRTLALDADDFIPGAAGAKGNLDRRSPVRVLGVDRPNLGDEERFGARRRLKARARLPLRARLGKLPPGSGLVVVGEPLDLVARLRLDEAVLLREVHERERAFLDAELIEGIDGVDPEPPAFEL